MASAIPTNYVQIEYVCAAMARHRYTCWRIDDVNRDRVDEQQDGRVSVEESVQLLLSVHNAVKGDWVRIKISDKEMTALEGANRKYNAYTFYVLCKEKVLPNFQYLPNQGDGNGAAMRENQVLQMQILQMQFDKKIEDLDRSYKAKDKSKRSELVEKFIEQVLLKEMNAPTALHPAPIQGANFDLKSGMQKLSKAVGGASRLNKVIEALNDLAKSNPAQFEGYIKLLLGE